MTCVSKHAWADASVVPYLTRDVHVNGLAANIFGVRHDALSNGLEADHALGKKIDRKILWYGGCENRSAPSRSIRWRHSRLIAEKDMSVFCELPA